MWCLIVVVSCPGQLQVSWVLAVSGPPVLVLCYPSAGSPPPGREATQRKPVAPAHPTRPVTQQWKHPQAQWRRCQKGGFACSEPQQGMRWGAWEWAVGSALAIRDRAGRQRGDPPAWCEGEPPCQALASPTSPFSPEPRSVQSPGSSPSHQIQILQISSNSSNGKRLMPGWKMESGEKWQSGPSLGSFPPRLTEQKAMC